MIAPYPFKKFDVGGIGGNIDCPFKLTQYTGAVPVGANGYTIGPGMVNNVLITSGTGPSNPIIVFGSAQMLVLQVNVTNVNVQGGFVYYGNPGSPPSPQENFPEPTLYVPLYTFDTGNVATRVFGCNNICVFSYVAFTQDKVSVGAINDYPHTNFWNWAIFS